MAVSPSDLLLSSGGHIDPDVFDALDNVEAQVSTWLDAAPDGLSDEATRAFAYWRAFSWKASREAHTGSVQVNGVGSVNKTDSQRAVWEHYRDEWRHRYEELRAEEEGEPDPSPPVRSQSVSSNVSWV